MIGEPVDQMRRFIAVLLKAEQRYVVHGMHDPAATQTLTAFVATS